MSKNKTNLVRIASAASAAVLSSALALPALAVAADATYDEGVALEEAATSKEDATAVKALMDAIMGSDLEQHLNDLGIGDIDEAYALFQKYLNLTSTQQGLVKDVAKAGLEGGKAELAKQLAAADSADATAVNEFVQLLSKVDLNNINLAELAPVATKYNDLSATQKAILGAALKAGLETTQKAVEQLVKPSEVERLLATMQRLYNPNTGEHFYTCTLAEKDILVGLGWKDEGIGWTAPFASETPVYRLYNANGSEHHYTISQEERDTLIAAGWTNEGIGWYSDDAKGTPVYRLYNPNEKANNHNYTTSTEERDALIAAGWIDEGIAWYGLMV